MSVLSVETDIITSIAASLDTGDYVCQDLQNDRYCLKNVSYSPFDLAMWYCQYQWPDSDIENDWSVWCQTHYDVTDKNNIGRFEGLDKHNRQYQDLLRY
jgi:hypothetical protein